jgi:hypothetical protein
MAKTEVYSWRVAAKTKAELQRPWARIMDGSASRTWEYSERRTKGLRHAAKRTNQSVGNLLDRIVREWLDARRSKGNDLAEQQRLHVAAAQCIGVLRGGKPHRAKIEEARGVIGARLAASHFLATPAPFGHARPFRSGGRVD